MSDELTDRAYHDPEPEDIDLLGWKIAKYLFPVWLAWTGGVFFGAGQYSVSSAVIQEVMTRPVELGVLTIPVQILGALAGMMAMTVMLYYVHQDHDE